MDSGSGEAGVFTRDAAGGPREVLAVEVRPVGLSRVLDGKVRCS